MYKYLGMGKSSFQRKNKNFTWKYLEIEKLAEHFKLNEQEIVKILRGK